MSALIVTVLLLAGLFITGYVTKRRFGVLGLALSAGAYLSLNWAATVTPFLESRGLSIAAPPLGSLVQVGLVLAPALVLLFSGPTYSKTPARIFGALAFAGLALVYISDILASILVLEESGGALYQILHDYKTPLITAGIVGALVDLLLTRTPKGHKDSKKASRH